MKQLAETLDPGHPLRLALFGETDRIDPREFCIKAAVWLRLLPPVAE